MELEKGQAWNYTNDFKSDSYCIITRIDELEEKIVHVQIKNAEINGTLSDIDHMPFSLDAFTSSVISIKGVLPISKDAVKAIATWEKDKGGVWEISISEAIGLIG